MSFVLRVAYGRKLTASLISKTCSWIELVEHIKARFEVDTVEFTYDAGGDTFSLIDGGDWEDFLARAIANDHVPKLQLLNENPPEDIPRRTVPATVNSASSLGMKQLSTPPQTVNLHTSTRGTPLGRIARSENGPPLLSMVAWSSLPPELIMLVLSHLNAEEHLACSTVSLRLRALAEPFLYRSPVLSRLGGDDAFDRGDEFAQLRRFVRTIVSRPTLGAFVKTLKVECIEDGFDYPDGKISAGELNAVMTEAERAEALEDVPEGFDARSDIDMLAKAAEIQGLSAGLILRGGCAGQTVLLLHHLTRLKRLVFVTSDAVSPVADAALGRLQGGVPVGLAVIEQLHMTNGGISQPYWEDGYHIRSCIPFMTLPCLVEFTMGGFTGLGMEAEGSRYKHEIEDGSDRESNIRNGLPVAPRASAVRSLSFVNSSVEDSLLQRIMGIPLELNKFSYEIAASEVGYSLFIPKSIAQNLLPHAHHLTHLCLTEKEPYESMIEGSGMGSLEAFTALRYLTASAVMLLGRPMSDSRPSLQRMASTNPFDALLPSSFISLHCVLNEWSFCEFLAATGLPYTFAKTKEKFTSLEGFIIDWKRVGGGRCGDLESIADVRDAMDEIPGLSRTLLSPYIVPIPSLPCERQDSPTPLYEIIYSGSNFIPSLYEWD